MSNELIGKLYSDVIENVISESRPDFEENGIDEGTLQELKQIWRERLTAQHVATMPWDIQQVSFNTTGSDVGGAIPGNISYTLDPSSPHVAVSQNGIVTPGGSQLLKQETPSKSVDSSPSTAAMHKPVSSTNGLMLPGGGHLPQADGAGELFSTTDIDLQLTNSSNTKAFPQADGTVDDSSLGSDLDDPEDDPNSENGEEDDEGGMIMLCLYDKVQRVKNKWKYVLKDGVANINGKDYVFSRGSGESEW